MLSRKWQIFRMVSYLHLVFTTGFMVLIFRSARGVSFLRMDYLIFPLFVLALVILLANSSINMYLLERFYPDRSPGKRLWRTHTVLFSLSLLVILGDAVLAALVSPELRRLSLQWNMEKVMRISTVIGICVTGPFVLWTQVSLRKTIRRNHEAMMGNFLDHPPA